MKKEIPDSELVDMQVAAHEYLGTRPTVHTSWAKSEMMKAYLAGRKDQYQQEDNIPFSWWDRNIKTVFCFIFTVLFFGCMIFNVLYRNEFKAGCCVVCTMVFVVGMIITAPDKYGRI